MLFVQKLNRKLFLSLLLWFIGGVVLSSMYQYLIGNILSFSDIVDLVFFHPIIAVLGVLIVASVIFDVVLYAFSKKSYMKFSSAPKLSAADHEHIRTTFSQACLLVSQGSPSNLRSAIIACDNLLDFVLKKLGYTGSLGEKLKSKPKELISLNDAWTAHKYRNKIVHDSQFEVLRAETNLHIELFKKVLLELGARL